MLSTQWRGPECLEACRMSVLCWNMHCRTEGEEEAELRLLPCTLALPRPQPPKLVSRLVCLVTATHAFLLALQWTVLRWAALHFTEQRARNP